MAESAIETILRAPAPARRSRLQRRGRTLLHLVMLCAMGSWFLLLIGSATITVQIVASLLG